MSDEPRSKPSDDAPAHQPHIPDSVSLPEITIKALILGVILAAILCGASAYLGLKAGMVVSTSIPASVISMAVLRLFRRHNILENNIVQTAASAGQSLAAGVIFTIPALVLMGKWTDFNYIETTIIAALGGTIGVLFTIPLRRVLIVDSPLKFPEGVATAEVLKVGEGGGRGIGMILLGGALGGLFKIGETGLKLWTGVVEGGKQIAGSIGYVGVNASPALLAVGYIVGINIAVLVFLGGSINWYIAIPIVASNSDWPVYELHDASMVDESWRQFIIEPDAPAEELAMIGEPVEADEWANRLWSKRTRYLGVGAMLVGGLWALLRLSRSVARGITASLSAYRAMRENGNSALPRTQRDTPMQWVGIALLISVIPVFLVFNHITGDVMISAVMACVMLVAGFLFSSVAAYMAGLVGSSNNPISGVTIATLLTSALLLLALGMDSSAGPAAAILIGAVVCCAAAIGGDNVQDLKAGHIVGATPWKQQVMQALGVGAAALVIAPVLSALLHAYGIGSIVVEGQEPLEAPQASLMSSVAQGVFTRDLPWDYLRIGMLIAAAVIVGDLILEARKARFRMPVLAVAVGIYLPLELTTPILFGGLTAFAVSRVHKRRIARAVDEEEAAACRAAKAKGERTGLLLAAGLITGEAILGILLAIPLALWQGTNHIAEWFEAATGLRGLPWPGVALLAAVMVLLFLVAARRSRRS